MTNNESGGGGSGGRGGEGREMLPLPRRSLKAVTFPKYSQGSIRSSSCSASAGTASGSAFRDLGAPARPGFLISFESQDSSS